MVRGQISGCSLGGACFLLDVSVTHPTMPSALRNGRSSRPLGAAKQRDIRKEAQNTPTWPWFEGATVIPLVLEDHWRTRRMVFGSLYVASPPMFMTESSPKPRRWWLSDFSRQCAGGLPSTRYCCHAREGTSQLTHPSEPQHQRYFQFAPLYELPQLLFLHPCGLRVGG
jgi:hypothetical protein